MRAKIKIFFMPNLSAKKPSGISVARRLIFFAVSITEIVNGVKPYCLNKAASITNINDTSKRPKLKTEIMFRIFIFIRLNTL